MAKENSIVHSSDDSGSGLARPVVRDIRFRDLLDALAKGFDDFKAVPTHLIFLILIYPIVMLILSRVAAGQEMLPLVFPLFAGYTLVGPLIAIGMYELSRRREMGLDTSRLHLFDVLKSKSLGAIVALGLVLTVVYFAWLMAALALYKMTFGGGLPDSIATLFMQLITFDLSGTGPQSIGQFAVEIITTRAGWTLALVGSGIGLVFAIVVLSLSAVSFPMLLDRQVGAWTAAQTSIRVVMANPMSMGMWGVIVAVALAVGSLPLFVGLAIVLPVLGHATWHLYRTVVEH
ncbi:MAG TPA: DUF2189 domain-containing protein [Alphaproteobacteria bacterium]|nr:DUF2189 domain-containing protein [Alphaproteobacteria bacterium]